MGNNFALAHYEHVDTVRLLRLRRNLGHQRAIAVTQAYIQQNVPCDAVVVMDADGEVARVPSGPSAAKEGKLDRIDPKTNKVSKTLDLGTPGASAQIAIGDGYVWLTMTGFPLTRIDPEDESVAQQFWEPAVVPSPPAQRHLAVEHQRRSRVAHRSEPDQSHAGGEIYE